MTGLLAACATAPGPRVENIPPPPPPQETGPIIPFRPDRAPQVDTAGVTPPHMRGRQVVRAALLLPFSSNNEAARREAQSMLNAAELALFERGGEQLLLIPKDDGGTRTGAEAATRAALAEGAHVVLGPLFAQAVEGAGAAARARGTPVIAFSTDRAVAGEGVYLLSFAPESEVRRAAAYARFSGARGIALLAADTALGRRVGEVLREAAARGEGPPVHDTLFYTPDNYNQATLLIEQIAAARDAGLVDAVYISDGTGAMRELAPVLRGNRLTAADIFMIGSESWRTDPAASTISVISGAYVASRDTGENAAFTSAYRAAFGESPSQLASLAYDAVALAAQLRGDAGDWDVIENPNGYLGADGLFRLPPGGVAERGLAIYQLTPTGAVLVEPAPSRFDLVS